MKFVFFLGAGLLAFGSRAAAMELMSPATQLGEKKVHAEVFYHHIARQDLNISVVGNNTMNVRGSTLASTSVSDLECEGKGDGMMAKVTFQPFDGGFRYYMIGGMNNYQISVPSGSFSNRYATDLPGYAVGGGLKYTLVPHTVVSPAFSVDISAMHSYYKLSKFEAGDGNYKSDTGYSLAILELQAALTLSKKFVFDLGDHKASFDPYLGVKVTRIRTGLDESATGAHYSGTKSGYAPFFGFKLKPFQYEGLVVEGSVLNELSAAIGLTLGF